MCVCVCVFLLGMASEELTDHALHKIALFGYLISSAVITARREPLPGK